MLRAFLKKNSRRLTAAWLAACLFFLSAWLLTNNSSLVRTSYDWSQFFFVQNNNSTAPVAMVYLDLDSYLREKQNPTQPWNRALHAQLLKRLTAAGATAVVFDIIFDAPSENPNADAEFVRAIQANAHVVLAGEISRGSQKTANSVDFQSLQLTRPHPMFLNAAATWGVANARMDDDFIVRQQFNGEAGFGVPSLSFATVKMLGLATNDLSPRWLRYYGQPLTIPHVSYSAALRSNEVSDDFFRGKIIFIGARPMTGTILERKDEFRSPLATWGDREMFMPAVEVHATQLLNMIQNDSLRRWPLRTEIALLLISATVSAWLLFSIRPLAAALLALLLEGGLFILALFLLGEKHLWFPWLMVGAVQIPGALAGSVLFQSLEWYQQKKKYEAQQRQAELKIREQATLIEKAQDAIFVTDLDGGIFYANSSAEKLYGWNKAGQKKMADGKMSLAEARQITIKQGEWLGEIEHVLNNGDKMTVSSRCTLIRDERGEPKSFLFINTDVTEKKKLEQEFFRAQRIESIGAMASGMAHDLNNSLSPVLMGLQLLRQQTADAETHRMLAVMENNTHRSADMVRQVLLFSRGRDGEKESVASGVLLRDMERTIRQTFSKNINVAALIPADLWPVQGNITQLHQVLLNLCVNARDAMPTGGQLTLAADNVEFSPTEAAQIPNAKPGRFVMWLVADTGQGISPEILPRIFEPFFTTKSVEKGTGLGLSTTARIIAAHGGFVTVKSDPGNGTSFEVYLPATEVVPTKENKKSHATPRPIGRGELILVADDEQSIREMISLGLTTQGYRVLTATNGAEAISLVRHHSAELKLVLVDDDMPVMNGQTAIAQLRQDNPSLAVVLMSSQATLPVTDRIKKLTKPFQLNELLEVVVRNLG